MTQYYSIKLDKDKGDRGDIHQNALDAFAMQNFMRGDYGFQEFGSGAGNGELRKVILKISCIA